MKSCKFCSTHVEDSTTHCPSCGSNTFRNLCENCGTTFESAYCPNCGVKAGQKKKICPECHSIFFTPACPHCGYTEIRKPVMQQTVIHEHVHVDSPDDDEEYEKQETKQSRSGCGCLVFILFFVIFGIIVFNTSARQPKKTSYSYSYSTQTAKPYATTKPRATATKDPTPTATPDPIIAQAQQAVDDYYTAHPESIQASTAQAVSAAIRAKANGTSSTYVPTHNVRAHLVSYMHGRGRVEYVGKEPDYVGAIGYATVYDDQLLDKNSKFANTPWKMPVYVKDKQFFEKSGTIPHKTPVIVIEQELTKPQRSNSYSVWRGYLHIIRLDTNEDCYLDVRNFYTSAYWNKPITEAADAGFCIATYKQVSNYYPVTGNGDKVTLDDGFVVLIPAASTIYASSPDKTNNSIKAIVFKEWLKGFGGVNVFFNAADLTITY